MASSDRTTQPMIESGSASVATLLTEEEVAQIFRVTVRTIRRWARTGWFDPVRIGGVTRYRRCDVELFTDPLPAPDCVDW